MNADTAQVIISEGTFEAGWREFPDNFVMEQGVSKVYAKDDSFVVVKVVEVIPPGPNELDDVKGKVISEYQTLLEEQWMESLRTKHKVEIRNKALKRIRKELNP